MNKGKNVNEKNKEDSIGKKMKNLRISPWMAGAIIGFLAAALQSIASMTKPPAYGFCMACHARDLINEIINRLSGERILATASIIDNPVWIPPLTIIGVLLGSFVAAKIYKEFRITKAEKPLTMLKMFILGALVIRFSRLRYQPGNSIVKKTDPNKAI